MRLFLWPFVRFKNSLAKPNRFWRDLDQFVVSDEFMGVERHFALVQLHGFVGGGGSHVGEFFLDRDVEIDRTCIFTNDHSFVNLYLRFYK